MKGSEGEKIDPNIFGRDRICNFRNAPEKNTGKVVDMPCQSNPKLKFEMSASFMARVCIPFYYSSPTLRETCLGQLSTTRLQRPAPLPLNSISRSLLNRHESVEIKNTFSV